MISSRIVIIIRRHFACSGKITSTRHRPPHQGGEMGGITIMASLSGHDLHAARVACFSQRHHRSLSPVRPRYHVLVPGEASSARNEARKWCYCGLFRLMPKKQPRVDTFPRGLHELLEQATTRARHTGPGCDVTVTSSGEVESRDSDDLGVGRPRYLLMHSPHPMHEK